MPDDSTRKRERIADYLVVRMCINARDARIIVESYDALLGVVRL